MEARVEIGKMHTETAVSQISSYLAEHVVYPTKMEEKTIDGMVILEMKLDQNGQIKSSKVVESHSKYFQESVEATITKMGSIKLEGSFYYGVLKFQIPIQFNITG